MIQFMIANCTIKLLALNNIIWSIQLITELQTFLRFYYTFLKKEEGNWISFINNLALKNSSYKLLWFV